VLLVSVFQLFYDSIFIRYLICILILIGFMTDESMATDVLLAGLRILDAAFLHFRDVFSCVQSEQGVLVEVLPI